MATQPTTTPEAEQGIESARDILTAALTGKPAASAPPAATPPTEAAPPATPPPPPASPAPAVPGTPEPAVQPVSQFTNPAAQRFLEMHGGNVEEALAKALDYNNRLSAFAKAHPEAFQPGGPAFPAGAPVAPETSTPFVEPQALAPEVPPPVADAAMNWEEISAETDRVATKVDEVCRGYTNQWLANDKAIKEAASEIQQRQQRLGYIDSLLKDDSIELPELKAEDYKDERRTLMSEIATMRQEAMLRVLHNERLDDAFRQRRSQIQDHIAGQYRSRAQEQAFTAELQQIENAEYQRLSTSWPGALTRTIEALKIAPDLKADFESYAKQMANASLADPNFEITDVDAFMSSVGRQYVGLVDRYHRAQAAQYGTLAQARAASPSPVPGPGTPAPATPVHSQVASPEQAMEDASRFLRERLRGMR